MFSTHNNAHIAYQFSPGWLLQLLLSYLYEIDANHLDWIWRLMDFGFLTLLGEANC